MCSFRPPSRSILSQRIEAAAREGNVDQVRAILREHDAHQSFRSSSSTQFSRPHGKECEHRSLIWWPQHKEAVAIVSGGVPGGESLNDDGAHRVAEPSVSWGAISIGPRGAPRSERALLALLRACASGGSSNMERNASGNEVSMGRSIEGTSSFGHEPGSSSL